MPDDIFAEMSDGNGNFVSFRIFVGAQRISSTTLRREIAVELHRRINRIPEDAPEVSCCAGCAACRAIEGHTPSLIEWATRESARYVVDRWMKGDF